MECIKAVQWKAQGNATHSFVCLNFPLKDFFFQLVFNDVQYAYLCKFSGEMILVKLENSGNNQVAESEVQSLRKNLSDEKIRNFELEQELKDLKSCCNCFEGSSVEATFAKVDTSLECVINTEAFESSETAEVC